MSTSSTSETKAPKRSNATELAELRKSVDEVKWMVATLSTQLQTLLERMNSIECPGDEQKN